MFLLPSAFLVHSLPTLPTASGLDSSLIQLSLPFHRQSLISELAFFSRAAMPHPMYEDVSACVCVCVCLCTCEYVSLSICEYACTFVCTCDWYMRVPLYM